MTIRTILSMAALMLALLAVSAVPALADLGPGFSEEPTVLIDTGVIVGDGVGISAYN